VKDVNGMSALLAYVRSLDVWEIRKVDMIVPHWLSGTAKLEAATVEGGAERLGLHDPACAGEPRGSPFR
jgi:hypothetical protein